MPALNTISADKLARLIGTSKSPALLDVRPERQRQAQPDFIPAALRRDPDRVSSWAADLRGQNVVVVCQDGGAVSQGVAAWLRHEGVADTETLEGGQDAWMRIGHPLVTFANVPPRDEAGRTVWVTKSRPKVDRIACPWLIRRFVDPTAIFLFVSPADVAAVAERFAGTAFDMEGARWSHNGDLCTFDMMVDAFNLDIAALRRLAINVRAADTDRLDLAPQAAGLLAISLGLSRQYTNDLEQLEAGLTIYDAFYRWCRDATDETHTWPVTSTKAARTSRKPQPRMPVS
jgi:rhodanese-related sulfurtransferase